MSSPATSPLASPLGLLATLPRSMHCDRNRFILASVSLLQDCCSHCFLRKRRDTTQLLRQSCTTRPRQTATQITLHTRDRCAKSSHWRLGKIATCFLAAKQDWSTTSTTARPGESTRCFLP